MRVLLPSEPRKIIIREMSGKMVTVLKTSWDSLGKTGFLSFENNPEGIQVILKW